MYIITYFLLSLQNYLTKNLNWPIHSNYFPYESNYKIGLRDSFNYIKLIIKFNTVVTFQLKEGTTKKNHQLEVLIRLDY